MSRRHDLVLVVIPLLAVSGLAAQHVAFLLESTVGVGNALLQLPLFVVGPIAATCLIGHELLVEPPCSDA